MSNFTFSSVIFSLFIVFALCSVFKKLFVLKDYSVSNMVQLELSPLNKTTLDLNLYKKFQDTAALYNSNLKVNSIDNNEVKDFIEDCLCFQEKISKDFHSLMFLKIQAASILIDDFEKTNSLKTKINYDE